VQVCYREFFIMISARLLIVLAAGACLLISCTESKRESASTSTASDAITQNMTRISTEPRFFIDQIATSSSPRADAEIPVSSIGPLVASGWAADFAAGPVSGVEIAIDQKPYAATYGLDRPDVAAALKNPAYAKSGFQFTIPSSQFSKGAHAITVRIINKGRSGYFETPPFHIRME
jgi:hypothetical protein